MPLVCTAIGTAWKELTQDQRNTTWHMAILLVDANPWKEAILINTEENSVMEDLGQESNEQPLVKRG